MVRIIISFVFLGVMTSTTAAGQALRATADTTKASDTTAVPRDSVRRFGTDPAPRPNAVDPIVVPRERSLICRSIATWKCAFYSAFVVGAIGYSIGAANSPKPEYERVGLFFGGTEVCTANCGMPHKAIVLGLTGSAIGGVGGWLLGRK